MILSALSHRLYVGSLHFNLTEADIKQVFEPFGELDFVDLHRDPMTGRSKGYAFLQLVIRLFIYLHLNMSHFLSQIDIGERKMLKWLWNKWKDLNLLAELYVFVLFLVSLT